MDPPGHPATKGRKSNFQNLLQKRSESVFLTWKQFFKSIRAKQSRIETSESSIFLKKNVSFFLGVFNHEDKGLRQKLIYHNLHLFIHCQMQKELLKKLLTIKSYDHFFGP